MLTQPEIQEIFQQHVPDAVGIRFVSQHEFILKALENPYILEQIRIGIYDFENIWTDFLSAACSYPQRNVLEICYDLIVSHSEGVADELTHAYVTMMAAHEAHHFHVNHVPDDVSGLAQAEVDCLRETMQAHPELSMQVEQFEAASPVFQRVYDRMRRAFPEQVFS